MVRGSTIEAGVDSVMLEAAIAVGDIAHQLPGSRIVETVGGIAVIQELSPAGIPFEIDFLNDGEVTE